MLGFGLMLALVAAGEARAAFLPASFSAAYEERFISSTDGKERKSNGKLDYQQPRHVRFEVLAPDPSTFVANPQTSWYYTPPFIEGEEGQVVVQKSAGLPFARFLDALAAGAKSNAGYDATLKDDTLTLTFKGKMKQELQLAQAALRARSGDAAKASDLGDFEAVHLVYGNGKKVEMRFSSFQREVKFPTGHFVFVIPPKTKVSEGK